MDKTPCHLTPETIVSILKNHSIPDNPKLKKLNKIFGKEVCNVLRDYVFQFCFSYV